MTTAVALATLVADVLGRESVDPSDHLFDLGIGSLTGVQLLSRIRDDFGVELDLMAPFEAGTVGELARLVDATGPDAGGPPLAPVPPEQHCLTWFQERFWNDLTRFGYLPAHVTRAFRITGAVDVDALRWAFDELVRRQRSLRTTFPERDGGPAIVVAEPGPAAFTVHHPAPEEVDDLVRALMVEPFDITRGPLYRFALLTTSPGNHLLLLNVHEIVSDGWSLDVVTREVGAHYAARVAGAPPLPELTVQYGDFAAWQRTTTDREALLAFWEQELAGAPLTLALPFENAGLPSPPPKPTATVALDLGLDLARRVRELCAERRVTPFVVYLSAYAVLLQRYTGLDDIVVNSPVANRNRTELEPLVGLFAVGNLPFRVDLGGDPSFADLLDRMRETTRAAFAHSDVPVEIVGEALARNLPAGIVRQTAPRFRYRVPDAELVLPGVQVEPFQAIGAQEHLALWVDDVAGRSCRMTLAYDTTAFGDDLARRMVTHAGRTLAAVLADPAAPLSTVDPLLPAERQPLTGAGDEPPEPTTLPALVAGAARRDPDAVALRAGPVELTFGALDARARRVAGHLAADGVTPGTAVRVERAPSADALVAALGVLYAGGTVVPGVADARVATALAATSEPTAPPAPVSPDTVAFALPGPVTHAAVARNAVWLRDRYGLDAGDTVAYVPGDGAAEWLFAVWPALAAGATVVTADAEAALRACGATVAAVPVPMAASLVEAPPERLRLLTLWGAWPPGGQLPVGERPRVAAHYLATGSGGVAGYADAADGLLAPVFTPAPGVALAVVGPRGHAVPPGAVGEPAVLGPAGPERTGDLARVTEDGRLAYVGRRADEIMLRGYRLTEVAACVEVVLAEHPAVAAAAVALVGVPPELTAFVCYAPGAAADEAELRSWLAAQAVPFGPSKYVTVDRLPARPDGSVIRSELARAARRAAVRA